MNTINRAKRLSKLSNFVPEAHKQIFTVNKNPGTFSLQNHKSYKNQNAFNQIPVRPFFGTKPKIDLQLYDTLELDQTSTQEEIKKQFFKLAKQYHPDVNKEKDA